MNRSARSLSSGEGQSADLRVRSGNLQSQMLVPEHGKSPALPSLCIAQTIRCSRICLRKVLREIVRATVLETADSGGVPIPDQAEPSGADSPYYELQAQETPWYT